MEPTTKENIARLLKLSRESHIRPLLVLLPPSLGSFDVLDESRFVSEDPLFREERKILPLARKRLAEIQRETGMENDVPLVDISRVFDRFEYGDPLYFDIIHWSDLGNDVIAEGMSRWLLSRKDILPN